VELPVGRRRGRVVADEVVRARITDDLLKTRRDVVAIDDRTPVCLLGENTERVLRELQILAPELRADVVRDVEFGRGEAAGVDRVQRHVVLVRGVPDKAELIAHLRLREPRRARLVHVALTRQRVGIRRERAHRQQRRLAAALGRHHVGEPLADNQQRLAPLLQTSQVHDEGFESGEGDVVADPFDRLGRIRHVALFEVVRGLVVVLAADELLEPPDHCVVVAGQAYRPDGLKRIHQPDHVGRPEPRRDELGEWCPDADRRLAPDVVIVEKHREHPHVVARGLGLLVELRANLARPAVQGGIRRGAAVERHELERGDRLRRPVLEHLKIVLRQLLERLTVPARHNDVHADEIDAGPEDRWLRVLRRRVARRRGGITRRLIRGFDRCRLLCVAVHAQHRECDDHGPHDSADRPAHAQS